MTKTKTNKWVEIKKPNGVYFFESSEHWVWALDITKKVNMLIKERNKLITQTQQDMLEWCLKEVKRISEKTTDEEIRNFPRRLNGEGKQKIRAKNYGWNLCAGKVCQIIKNKMEEGK